MVHTYINAEVLDNVCEFLETCPPAVEGQNGDWNTYVVAS